MGSGHGSRVLVVDDEEQICHLLTKILNQHHFTAESCTRASAAIERLRQQPFDAVISDLNMPEISGIEFLKVVSKEFPRVAFVMATGESDIRIGIKAMKDGADDYLVKPVQPEAVIASIERALYKKRIEKENEEYKQKLEEMVNQRTIQLHNALRRIELTYDDTLEALGAALDLRDNETAGHSRRVTYYCEVITKAMGVKEDEFKQIMRGAYLHDIGKIAIPDAILLKPGKLTEEETAIMQSHVRVGYDLVKRVLFLAPAADIVLTHQERYDGTGYPQGLIGNEIPLGSRIFAVADTLDAMTSDRPYRRALSLEVARQEIEDQSGRQFDPKVVEVFLDLGTKFFEECRSQSQRPRTLPGSRLQSKKEAD